MTSDGGDINNNNSDNDILLWLLYRIIDYTLCNVPTGPTLCDGHGNSCDLVLVVVVVAAVESVIQIRKIMIIVKKIVIIIIINWTL